MYIEVDAVNFRNLQISRRRNSFTETMNCISFTHTYISNTKSEKFSNNKTAKVKQPILSYNAMEKYLHVKSTSGFYFVFSVSGSISSLIT